MAFLLLTKAKDRFWRIWFNAEQFLAKYLRLIPMYWRNTRETMSQWRLSVNENAIIFLQLSWYGRLLCNILTSVIKSQSVPIHSSTSFTHIHVPVLLHTKLDPFYVYAGHKHSECINMKFVNTVLFVYLISFKIHRPLISPSPYSTWYWTVMEIHSTWPEK